MEGLSPIEELNYAQASMQEKTGLLYLQIENIASFVWDQSKI